MASSDDIRSVTDLSFPCVLDKPLTQCPSSPPTPGCKRQECPSSPSPADILVLLSPEPQYEPCTPSSEPQSVPQPLTHHPLHALPFVSAGDGHLTPQPRGDCVSEHLAFWPPPQTGMESCRRGVGICSSGDAVANRPPVRNSTGSLSPCTAHVGTSTSLIRDGVSFLWCRFKVNALVNVISQLGQGSRELLEELLWEWSGRLIRRKAQEAEFPQLRCVLRYLLVPGWNSGVRLCPGPVKSNPSTPSCSST